MKQLEELMASIVSQGQDEAPAEPERADLLLYAPCPVKLAMKDGVAAVIEAEAALGRKLSAHIPMGCTSVDPYDPIYKTENPEDLPGIIASIGYGDFWRKSFVERFLGSDLFEAVLPERQNPMHLEAGLADPRGRYTVYGVTPYIFLADTRRLGSLPVPRTWEELLDPRYAGEIVMCGDGDDMADAVILNLYKDFGPDGLKQLARSAKCLMHSSKMAKIVGSNDPEAGGIFIIPSFFAESVTHGGHVKMVWPEDGAAASPLYFLAKKAEAERLRGLLDFLLYGFARIDSAAWFVPLAGAAPAVLPKGAKLKWLGWDYVAAHDVNRLRDEMRDYFLACRKEFECGL